MPISPLQAIDLRPQEADNIHTQQGHWIVVQEQQMKAVPRQKEQPLDTALLAKASVIFRVLSHQVRLRIVELLMTDQLSVSDLAETMGMPQASVSQHLNLLRTNGIVEGERRGQRVYYSVISPQAHAMINCLREHADRI
jgi:DNA-binding transcriptional ArsR family regulator